MKLEHDSEADAVYLYIEPKKYAYGEDLDDERRIDYASDGSVIGVELLCVSEGVNVYGLPHTEEIVKLLKANGIKSYETNKIKNIKRGESAKINLRR